MENNKEMLEKILYNQQILDNKMNHILKSSHNNDNRGNTSFVIQLYFL